MTGVAMKYRAFISYSHADHGWGKWLHAGLERFRAPKRLVGHGPRRLGRCFRDEAEMGAAAHLPEKIAAALSASEWLIVVCSPRSAASQWVNKEIADFKALRREDRVLALVVDGAPGGSREDGAPAKDRECFPDALRVAADGGVVEPLAVDVRKFGRGDALVRLVSEIIGVGYDDLREREVRRRRLARIATGALFATGLVLTAGAVTGGYFAAQNYAQASAERSALYAREANALFDEGRHPEAMLMALSGDPAAQGGMVQSWFNPDGYGAARHALVRSVTHNRLERVSGTRTAEAHAADFSADGSRVATLASDGYARIWKVGEDRPLAEIYTGDEGWAPIALHPDGERVLTGSQDGVVRLWKAGEAEPLATYDGKGGVVLSLALDATGDRFLAGYERDGARLWPVAGGEPLAAYQMVSLDVFEQPGPDDDAFATASYQYPGYNRITAVGFDQDERHAVLGSSEGAVQIHDVSTGVPVGGIVLERSVISSFVNDPRGLGMLILSQDGRARHWMPGHTEARHDYGDGTHAVEAVAWKRDGSPVAVLSENGVLRLWRQDGYAPYAVMSAGAGPTVTDMAALGEGSVVTAGQDSLLRRWRVADMGHEHGFDSDESPTAVALLRDGQRIAAGYGDGTVRIWRLGKPEPEAVFESSDPYGEVESLVAHPDGERLLIGRSQYAELWRIGETESEAYFREPDHLMAGGSFSFLKKGERLLSAALGVALVWPLAGDAPAIRHGDGDMVLAAAAVLPDGERFIAGGEVLALWRDGKSTPVAMFKDGKAFTYSIAMLADGERFLTVDGDSRARLWRVGQAAPLERYDLGGKQPRFVAMHPDDRHFMVVMSDGVIDVFRLGQQGAVASFTGDAYVAPSLAILPDGRRFIAGDSAVRVWRLPEVLFADAAGEVAAACEMLRAVGVMDFAEADWQRFPILDRSAPHPCRGVWGFDPRSGR